MRPIGLLLSLLLLLLNPMLARAAEIVDIELVLAIDSSSSVDDREFGMQLKGLADAFRDPKILAAIQKGQTGIIAVTLMEWSSQTSQRVTIPWVRIANDADAHHLADRIDAVGRQIETGSTSISAAIRRAASLFENNGFEGRRVIDLSGDGYNNQGPAVAGARDEVTAKAITINAVAIENQVLGLAGYFRGQLIGGFGAFVEVAADYEDYQRAIRRKLLREIQSPPMS